jgi:hypothetical protein
MRFAFIIHIQYINGSMEQSPPSETSSQSAKQEIPPFMQPENSLTCLQEPATGAYLQQEPSSKFIPAFFYLRSILMSFCHLCPGLPSYLSGFLNILHPWINFIYFDINILVIQLVNNFRTMKAEGSSLLWNSVSGIISWASWIYYTASHNISQIFSWILNTHLPLLPDVFFPLYITIKI